MDCVPFSPGAYEAIAALVGVVVGLRFRILDGSVDPEDPRTLRVPTVATAIIGTAALVVTLLGLGDPSLFCDSRGSAVRLTAPFCAPVLLIGALRMANLRRRASGELLRNARRAWCAGDARRAAHLLEQAVDRTRHAVIAEAVLAGCIDRADGAPSVVAEALAVLETSDQGTGRAIASLARARPELRGQQQALADVADAAVRIAAGKGGRVRYRRGDLAELLVAAERTGVLGGPPGWDVIADQSDAASNNALA